VARRVGDDEAATPGREVAVGDVDGDTLFALGRQAVDQQREIEPGAAGPARFRLQRLDLVLGQKPAVEEQPADQGRLAVVDAAAGDEAQQAQK
jgi:hypothetical protein